MHNVPVSLEQLEELESLVYECDHASYCDLADPSLAGEPSPIGPCTCGRDELLRQLAELKKQAVQQ